MEREYEVLLYAAPDSRRGWIAYLSTYSFLVGTPTSRLKVTAKNGNQAKERAITKLREIRGKQTDPLISVRGTHEEAEACLRNNPVWGEDD